MTQNQNIYFYHKEEPEIFPKLQSLCELAQQKWIHSGKQYKRSPYYH